MDTFMDQISGRNKAQEIIRANGEAESEQMAVMKVQVREYQDCLDRMKGVAEELTGLQEQIKALPDVQAGFNEEAVTELKAQMEQITRSNEEQLGKLSQELMDNLGSGDDFHKECVRIYRNVQAVVLEESEKSERKIEENTEAIERKVGGVKAIAIVSLIFSIIAAAAPFVIHYFL